MKPVVRTLLIVGVLVQASFTPAATLEGVVTVDGRAASDAVVYLDAPNAAAAPTQAAPQRAVMGQKNLAFVPRVLPVMRGTVVEFTNSDDVDHNVFSPSAIAGKFNLGTYGPGAASAVTLDTPGDVRILCNIHMEMEAHILVLDGPYFSAVAQDGHYRITDVPAGTYTVKIWQGRWVAHTQVVDLPASGSRTADIIVPK